MATGPNIDYDLLQQDAMRGIVRAALRITAETGELPGDHHFYISFMTQAPGVILSKRLREKYPQEMTIVLQHRFWDLIVTDQRFEVKLTFDGIPERLVVPYTAIKVFMDPSIRFGLQFDSATVEEHQSAPSHTLTMDAAFDAVGEARLDTPTQPAKRTRAPRKPRSLKDGMAKSRTGDAATDLPDSDNHTDDDAAVRRPALEIVADTADAIPSAKVVSLDLFRKK
jgi:hypothetical protein